LVATLLGIGLSQDKNSNESNSKHLSNCFVDREINGMGDLLSSSSKKFQSRGLL